MKKLFYLLHFSFLLLILSCDVEDLVLTGTNTGIGSDNPTEALIKLLDESGELIDFDFDENGQVNTPNPELIKRVSVDGDVKVDLNLVFLRMPELVMILTSGTTFTSGDLSNMPESLAYIDIGPGNISGKVIFHESMETFRINQGHDISFDVAEMPKNMINLCVNSGQIFGNIDSSFPSGMLRFVVMGKTTLSGDYGLIQGNFPTTFSIDGFNQIDEYTSGKVDFSKIRMRQFLHPGSEGHGFSSSEVDNLLIDLSKSNWAGLKKISIAGSHSPRTSLSDIAVASLIEQGVSVETNL